MTVKSVLTSILLVPLWAGAAMAQQQGEDMSAADPLEPRLGWTLTPVAPGEDAPLSELDRLSQSPSGVHFGVELYDSKSDNPLEAVSVTLRALDKITATYKDIEIPIGEEAAFGPLTMLPRTCDKRPPEETPETTVFLEVYSSKSDISGARAREARGQSDEANLRSTIRLPGEGTREEAARPALFRGWMFASSPSLNALEHPVYDVWVIDCKMVDPRT